MTSFAGMESQPKLTISAVGERSWKFVRLKLPQGLTALSGGGPTFVGLAPVGSGPGASEGCLLPAGQIRDYLQKKKA